jgi:accessory gene regulator protein AgrB
MQTTELPSAISDTTLHAMRIINDFEIRMYAFLLVTGINLIHQLLLLFMVVAFELSVELMRAFSFGVSLGF